MPDLREVFEMTTKQIKPEVDAWREQQERQRATRRKGKVGAFAVAAAIGIGAVTFAFLNRPGQETPAPIVQPPQRSDSVDQVAREVATSFVEAIGAFDAGTAGAHLAEGASLPQNLTPEELPLLVSMYEAQGYDQTLHTCQTTGTSALGTTVRCPFDYHTIRSDEIGRGPYLGSYWDLTIVDGEITAATQNWEIEEFSGEMWEPFLEWVSATHPEDFDVMYTGGGTNFRVTEDSIRLWEQNSKQYVKEVRRGDAD